ncbi:hypothetical protein LCGC14_0416910 [marine sediment metagenome]|uniref:Uncharacterized protein n=1 Tax=marine sediment metagenome TaxID=412755 RepID=A0A0F9TA85_9ZZZZ
MSELEYWCSPYKITYPYRQVTWLLDAMKELRVGIWPPHPEGRSSGYIDPRIVLKSGEYKAYTENIGNVAGTLERRLKKTGYDGAMAYLVYSCGLSYHEVGRLFCIPEAKTIENVELAIRYCCGRKDKRSTYYQYKKICHDYAQRKQKEIT